MQPIVRFRSITKRFPGVVALHDVSFDVLPGSCHALMGENGAGKSTLGKVLAGVLRPDGGHLEVGGTRRDFAGPLDARRAGVGIVHQELLSCPNLSVAENLRLADLPRLGPFLDRGTLRRSARALLDEVGASCGPDDELGNLPTAQVQLVGIAAALGSGAKVIVLDEPTSSLSLPEAERLHGIIARLRAAGTTFIYVSHRMEDVFRTCDAVTVLRDGGHVETRPLAGTTEDDIVRMMIGRTLERYFPAHAGRPLGEEQLRVEGLSSPGTFRDVSFRLRAGEVLGLAGLVGAGRTEVALALFGLDPAASGKVFVGGRPVSIRAPRDAMALGIGLVPEDRKRQGLILGMTSGENITLSSLDRLARLGFVRFRREAETVAENFRSLRVRGPGPDAPAAGLSGGNQQKLVLAKWLARRSRILIFDEPTRGVDVGAKGEIHALIDRLAAEGAGVLLISSELPEVLNLSTRILVLRQGRVSGELDRRSATQERAMELMAGVGGESPLPAGSSG
jgi:ABC-type sugar transport system ATPase subunit